MHAIQIFVPLGDMKNFWTHCNYKNVLEASSPVWNLETHY